MQKIGHPLRDIEGFPLDAADKLRDMLSVTTAEEFVDLARRYPAAVQSVLGADDKQLAELRDRAGSAAPLAETLSEEPPPDDYPFATGHDAPPEGHDTFEP
jgi:hypothetical protein